MQGVEAHLMVSVPCCVLAFGPFKAQVIFLLKAFSEVGSDKVLF